MFGAAGSAACATAAKDFTVTALAGQHCYSVGPADTITDLISATARRGVRLGAGRPDTDDPAGLGGAASRFAQGYGSTLPWSAPNAQYFVLRDHVALFGNEITNPQQSTDQAGSPDVTFGFTGQGANAFQNVTSKIAHRGHLVSGLGQTLDQHFAVALDTQLITVPLIDFKQNPDGIPVVTVRTSTAGSRPIHRSTWRSELRLGALPIKLALISASPGLGDARQAGAQPGPDRRCWSACWSWCCSCSSTTGCSA